MFTQWSERSSRAPPPPLNKIIIPFLYIRAMVLISILHMLGSPHILKFEVRPSSVLVHMQHRRMGDCIIKCIPGMHRIPGKWPIRMLFWYAAYNATGRTNILILPFENEFSVIIYSLFVGMQSIFWTIFNTKCVVNCAKLFLKIRGQVQSYVQKYFWIGNFL